MVDFFADNFSNCVIVAVLLLAMFPMLESKAAIPFALSVAIWGDQVLSPVVAFFVAFLGSMLPAILVILLSRFIKNRTSGFVHDRLLSGLQNKYKNKIDKLNFQNTTFKKCLTLCTFVAIPLPLTGAYTGSLVAGMTNLKLWQCFLSVFIGELISCAVVLLLCLVFENSVLYIFLLSLALVAIFIVINLLLWAFHKLKKRKENREIEIKCL